MLAELRKRQERRSSGGGSGFEDPVERRKREAEEAAKNKKDESEPELFKSKRSVFASIAKKSNGAAPEKPGSDEFDQEDAQYTMQAELIRKSDVEKKKAEEEEKKKRNDAANAKLAEDLAKRRSSQASEPGSSKPARKEQTEEEKLAADEDMNNAMQSMLNRQRKAMLNKKKKKKLVDGTEDSGNGSDSSSNSNSSDTERFAPGVVSIGAKLDVSRDSAVRTIQASYATKTGQQPPSRDSAVLALRTTEALYFGVRNVCFSRVRSMAAPPLEYYASQVSDLEPRAVRNFCGRSGIRVASALELAAVCLQLSWKP